MPGIKQGLNRLINEKSPYLQQHAHDPVDWYPWSKEAFDKATAEGKPLFVSIGYSTCHWCHVMEKESFEDEKVANLLNQNLVSVKVDREERPDIDNIYMKACILMTGTGVAFNYSNDPSKTTLLRRHLFPEKCKRGNDRTDRSSDVGCRKLAERPAESFNDG
jgi:hypothetical protein